MLYTHSLSWLRVYLDMNPFLYTTAWLTRTVTNIWNKHVWWLAPPPPAASYNSHKIIINTFRFRSWRSLNILRGHFTIPKRSHGRPRKPSNWLLWDVLPIRIVKLSTGSPSSLIKLAHVQLPFSRLGERLKKKQLLCHHTSAQWKRSCSRTLFCATPRYVN